MILANDPRSAGRLDFDHLQDKLILYRFRDTSLLQEALTHSSFANENPGSGSDNERLEFLGDSILSAVISKQLYLRLEQLPEGRMTRIRSLTVRSESLSAIAEKLLLPEFLRLGQGEEKTLGRLKRSNAEDAMEALIGAVFLDGGWEAAETFVLRLFQDTLDRAIGGEIVYDYKSRLYEYLQMREVSPDVQFVLLAAEGPAHERQFTFAVQYKGILYPSATASSKKSAEQEAARIFLESVEVQDKEGFVTRA